MYAGGERRTPPGLENVIDSLDKCAFLDCSVKNDVLTVEGNYLNQAKLSTPTDSELATTYSEVYEIGKNWEFVPHPDFPKDPSRVAILDQDKRLFVDGFGDGVRYGIAICACAKNISDTVFLIEEIESHQHPKALKYLIKNLLQIAEKNNLQLVVSTHSYDAFRYFYYSFDQHRRKQHFRCFHVVKDPSSGKVEAKPSEDVVSIANDIFGVERD